MESPKPSIRGLASVLLGELRSPSYATLEARLAASQSIGTGKTPEPTKTGPRTLGPKKTARQREKRKARKEREARARAMNEGRFFLRFFFTTKRVGASRDVFGRVTPAHDIQAPAEARVAKILQGDLWIRRDHSNPDTDPTQWSKAKNAKAERLNQEIRQVAGYLASHEMREEDAQELLDLLFAHLGEKIER